MKKTLAFYLIMQESKVPKEILEKIQFQRNRNA